MGIIRDESKSSDEMNKTIYVRFFGQLIDVTGTANAVLNNIKDTDEAIAKLKELYPLLKESTFVIGLDKRVVNTNTALADRQTIAVMPPFSGG